MKRTECGGIGKTCKGAASAIAVLGGLILIGSMTAAPACAVTIHFEDAAPGSDAADLGQPDVEIVGGLILNEELVEILLGISASGKWNTTENGEQGVLNTLGAVLSLDFAVAISALDVDVLALPNEVGEAGTVLLLAFAGNQLVGSDASDPSAIGDSGLPEDSLSVAFDGITRIELCAGSAARLECLDAGRPSSVWADEIRFEPIPEPATVVLLGLTLAALASRRVH